MALPVINTREDLDALQGTPEHFEFLRHLAGTLTQKRDTAIRPADYGRPEYQGPLIPPQWTDVEDTTTAQKFGYTKTELLELVR